MKYIEVSDIEILKLIERNIFLINDKKKTNKKNSKYNLNFLRIYKN